MALLGIFLLAALVNGAWMLLDERPPSWDAALHLTNARRVESLLVSGEFSGRLLTASPYYPPLFYFLAAPFLATTPGPPWFILLQTGFLAVLALSTYALARRLWGDRRRAVLAAFLTVAFPHVQWLSREFMIDLAALAVNTLVLALALSTEGFRVRRRALRLGAAVGVGLLLKWTLLFTAAIPLLWLMVDAFRRAGTRPERRQVVDNILAAGVVAGVVAWPWYLANFRFLVTHFVPYTQGLGTVEGDPSLWTLDGWTFYLRALLGHQLFVVFFVLFLAAAVSLAVRKPRPAGLGFLWAWIGGVYVVFSLFANKAPRHLSPVLPAVALLLSSWVFRRESAARARVLAAFCVGVAAFQWWMVTFGAPFLPDSVLLAVKHTPAYQERILRFKGADPVGERLVTWPDGWFAYNQTAFGLWGAPAREDWRLDEILRRARGLDGPKSAATGVKPRLCIGLVPDAARFNVWSFRERAEALRIGPSLIWRVASAEADGREMNHYRFILVKSGNQGPSWGTAENRAVCALIRAHPDRFPVRGEWPLPDGSRCWMYENAAFRDQGFNPGIE
ncbi:MAG: hypothetical protein KA419_00550 [Acidobacteria bacterium]|nr:hypothetical protein [Acidobacteriota bacterium]